MATSITTTYDGIGALDIISKSLLSATTLEKGYITVLPNIKKKYKLVIGSGDNLIQLDSCAFSAQGTVSLTEREIEPVKLKVNFQDCKTQLEEHWQAALMKPGALNSSHTIPFDKFLLDYVSESTAKGMEELIWKGNEAGSGGAYATYPFLTSANGFVAIAKADSAVPAGQKITSTTITASNVIAEITKVYNAIPDEIFDKENLAIFVSRKTYRLYRQAIQNVYVANSGVVDITKKIDEISFQGIPLHIVGIADNTMFAGVKENLFFATDLVSDLNTVKVLDLSETTGDDYIRVKSRFTGAVNYAISTEVVVYTA